MCQIILLLSIEGIDVGHFPQKDNSMFSSKRTGKDCFLEFWFLESFHPPLPQCFLSHRCRSCDVGVSIGAGLSMIS